MDPLIFGFSQTWDASWRFCFLFLTKKHLVQFVIGANFEGLEGVQNCLGILFSEKNIPQSVPIVSWTHYLWFQMDYSKKMFFLPKKQHRVRMHI